MSPRLIIALALAGIVALGAGAVWLVVQPRALGKSGGSASIVQLTFAEERREHRQKFFSGDPERDIRGGEVMKPRW
ncbi:type IV secretion system protein TrbK (plasmid) [Ensifer sp. WSM1721]|uniref:entry exclusion protein TrbK n=1 Tax=Ensifer sp. WSM1721 TaxID=1041159 RepID=UPI00047C0C4D|nr:entry exclusion protein TrbK [Ensifer sp. WSM1721]